MNMKSPYGTCVVKWLVAFRSHKLKNGIVVILSSTLAGSLGATEILKQISVFGVQGLGLLRHRTKTSNMYVTLE